MSNSSEGKQTLIEAGTKFTGSFNSDNPIVVRGTIEGEVSGPSLTVADTGVVSGKVKVKEMYSRGEISGEYEAENVHLSGKVRDQTVIRAKVLEVKLAAEKGGMELIFGEVDLQIGDVPEKNEVIEGQAKASNSAPPPAAESNSSPTSASAKDEKASKGDEKKPGSAGASPGK